MRRDRNNPCRSLIGKLRAASLLLTVACAPALAATDIRCDRTDGPSDRLRVETVDLASEAPDALADAELPGDFSREGKLTVPDFSARSAAILREIFDEPVRNDEMEFIMPAPHDVAQAPDGATRRNATGLADEELPMSGMPSAEAQPAVPERETRLPGVSEEDTLRYRREMFRTDI